MVLNGYKNMTVSTTVWEQLKQFIELNKLSSLSSGIAEILLDNEMLKLENKRLRRRFQKETQLK